METVCENGPRNRLQDQILGFGGNAAVPPPPTEYGITIMTVLNGFTVNVGCKTVVFETREKLLSELERYLKNPQQVQKEYLAK